MKKTLIILCAILVGVFIVLSVLDKSEYALEKKVYRIDIDFREIAKDPNVIPEQKFGQVAEGYLELVNHYQDSSLAPVMYLRAALTYTMQKNYEKARAVYQQMYTKYRESPLHAATAIFNTGMTYEAEENSERAIDFYKRVIDEYPLTDVGLNTPMYLVDYYKRLNREQAASSALRDAVSFYRKIAEENPNSTAEFGALRILVTAYYAKQEWRAAVETLGKILMDYPNAPYMDPQRANLMIRSINTVSMMQLKDYELPANIYRKFIEQNPQHPLNNTLEQMIVALKELKDKNVVMGQGGVPLIK